MDRKGCILWLFLPSHHYLFLSFALCRRVWAAGVQDRAEERDREGWSHGSAEV